MDSFGRGRRSCQPVCLSDGELQAEPEQDLEDPEECPGDVQSESRTWRGVEPGTRLGLSLKLQVGPEGPTAGAGSTTAPSSVGDNCCC